MAEVSAPTLPPRSNDAGEKRGKTGIGAWIGWSVIALVVGVFIPVAFVPLGSLNNFGKAERSALCQNTRAIGTAMYRYSLDHKGQYPTGNSSTEVFQKLIDGHYVSDPTLFYFGMGIGGPGKTKAISNTLKPENVCFDVTVPVNDDSPNGLPFVFVTGFKITYEPEAGAVPLFEYDRQMDGIAAVYKDSKHPTDLSIAWFGLFNVVYQDAPLIDKNGFRSGPIPNFIPSDFNPAGKKYQQLTPDGPLSP